MDVEKKFEENFKCPKCGNVGAYTKKLAMSGTGFSRFVDVQLNKYLFVSCKNCGYTEIYNLKVLTDKKFTGSDIFEILFGGG